MQEKINISKRKPAKTAVELYSDKLEKAILDKCHSWCRYYSIPDKECAYPECPLHEWVRGEPKLEIIIDDEKE